MSEDTSDPQCRVVTLHPKVHAPRTARRTVRYLCAGAGLPSRLVDDATFVAGELVTQSIRQTHSPVRMQVILRTGEVTVRVQDQGTVAPAESAGSLGATRAWEIVKRLSSSYGYRCDRRGRETWAQLR